MSVVSGLAGASAAGKAADAQEAAAREAAAVQKEMFDISRSDAAPWRMAGMEALRLLMGTPIYAKPKASKGKQAGATATAAGGETAGLGYTKAGNPATGWQAYDGGGYLVPDVDLIRAGQNPNNYPGYQTNFGGEETFMGTNQQIPPGYRLMSEQTIRQLKLPGAGPPQTGDTTTGKGDIIGYQGGLLNEGPGEFTDSPDYQVRLKRGLNALVTKGAALGRTGGALEKDIVDYAEDSATLALDNQRDWWLRGKVNPLMSIAGLGQVATSSGGNQAVATGQGIANTALAGGTARASGYINQANALKGASNTAIDAYSAYKGYNALTGGGAWSSAAKTYGGGGVGEWYS